MRMKNTRRPILKLTTSSLPDIVFMLLFFFMTVTVLRNTQNSLSFILPQVSELTKLERPSLTQNIIVGFKGQDDPDLQITLNDKIGTVDDIPAFIQSSRALVSEYQHQKMITDIKMDRKIEMGVLQDVKTELRKVGQLKINYAALSE